MALRRPTSRGGWTTGAAVLALACSTTRSTPVGAIPQSAGMVAAARFCRVSGAWDLAGSPVMPPRVRVCVLPWYPETLRLRGEEGQVAVRVRVDSAGVPDPAAINVVESTAPELTAATQRAAPFLRFAPAAAGEERPVVVELPFTFNLR